MDDLLSYIRAYVGITVGAVMVNISTGVHAVWDAHARPTSGKYKSNLKLLKLF